MEAGCPRSGAYIVGFSFWLVEDLIPLCTYMAERHSELSSAFFFFIRTLILSGQDPALMTSFNLNYVITSNIVTLEVRPLIYKFGGGVADNSIHSTY
jgi:hypothetical protein